MELDWQHKFQKSNDRRWNLFETEKWTDCRFLVGVSSNQKLIAGHKLILATASPVFERMFYGQFADNNDDPIVIPDVQPETFSAMLKYIYSDRIDIGSYDNASELYYAAKKYMLPDIVNECTNYFLDNLSPQNACRAYEIAKLFDQAQLMESSMQVITSSTQTVLEHPSFLDIDFSTLLAILDQDELYINSELDLFNALLHYLNSRGMLSNESVPTAKELHNNKKAKGHGFDTSTEKATAAINRNLKSLVIANEKRTIPTAKREEILADTVATDDNLTLYGFMDFQRKIPDENMLREAVKKIRFLAMTAKQFVEGPAHSKLLQHHEALAIITNILSPSNKNCPMPKGFCKHRNVRQNHIQHRKNYYDHRQYYNLVGGIRFSDPYISN